MKNLITNLEDLKKHVDNLDGMIRKIGLDPKKINIKFVCNDRSEGQQVDCTQVDQINFDLINPDEIKMELS